VHVADVLVLARLVQLQIERVALLHAAVRPGREVAARPRLLVNVVRHRLVVRERDRLARLDGDVLRVELDVLHAHLGAATAASGRLLLRGAAATVSAAPTVVIVAPAGH
jgi:hypothetical protein